MDVPKMWGRIGMATLATVTSLLALPALASAGTRALSWGNGQYGALGIGSSEDSATPIVSDRLAGFTSVTASAAAGGRTAIALRPNGNTRVWGPFGMDAEGEDSYWVIPGKLMAKAVSAAIGDDSLYLVQADGSVLRQRWDTNDPATVIAGLDGVAEVAAGDGHVLARHTDGTVSAWGRNGNGQLGDGTTETRQTPQKVPGLTGVGSIAAGASESYAVLADGNVMAWGRQVWDPAWFTTSSQVETPEQIPGLAGVEAVSAADAALAVTDDGHVFTWGPNRDGQLCDGSTGNGSAPALVAGIDSATEVAAGMRHSLIRLEDGTVLACGSNAYGQLGVTGPDRSLTPVAVPGLVEVTGIAAGSNSSYAIQEDSAPVATIRLAPDYSGETWGSIRGSGLACGPQLCRGSYPVGATVSFTADSIRASRFTSWSGPCTGDGDCTATVTADATLRARFMMLPRGRVAPETGRGNKTVYPRLGSGVFPIFVYGRSRSVFGTRVMCRLYRKSRRGTRTWKKFRRCTNPNRIKGLKTGRYVLLARAANRFGYDRSPVKFRFRIKLAR